MKKIRHIFAIVILILSGSSAEVFAQSDTLKVFPALEISSFRPGQFATGQVRMESDAATLKLVGQQGLQEFLQTATPLSFRTYGTGISSVSARGTGSSHTALLWNGINIQNTLSGIVDLPLFETAGADRISVKYGASTALFGSGAIGATIICDNEKPQERGLHFSVNAGAGSFGYRQTSTEMKAVGRRVASETRVSTQFADNDFSFRNDTELGAPLQKAVNASYKRANFSQHLFFDLKKGQFIKVHFWHSQNKRALMPSLTSADDNALLRDTSTRVVAEWSVFRERSIFKLRTYFASDNNVYTADAVDHSSNKLRTFVSEAEMNRDFGKNMHSRLALNYTKEQTLSTNFSANHGRDRLALLLNQTFTARGVADFSINLRQELYDGILSPFTFSTGAERRLNARWKLRAAVSRVYNLPALNDLYWDRLGNPDLRAEKGWSSEAGLNVLLIKDSKQAFAIDLTAYRINLKNRILWYPVGGIWRPGNLNEMHTTGLEFFGKYSRKAGDWNFSVNPQYQLAFSRGDEGKQLIYVPVHNGTLALCASYRRFSVIYHQVASSRRYMSSDHSTWTKGFTLSGLSTTYTAKLGGTQVSLSARAMNLFNSAYQVIQYFPNPGRNFRADLTLQF